MEDCDKRLRCLYVNLDFRRLPVNGEDATKGCEDDMEERWMGARRLREGTPCATPYRGYWLSNFIARVNRLGGPGMEFGDVFLVTTTQRKRIESQWNLKHASTRIGQ